MEQLKPRPAPCASYHALAGLEPLVGNVHALAGLKGKAETHFGAEKEASRGMHSGGATQLQAGTENAGDPPKEYESLLTPMKLALAAQTDCKKVQYVR